MFNNQDILFFGGIKIMVYDKPHGLPEAAETTKYPRPN
jgi:hypothetical protein